MRNLNEIADAIGVTPRRVRQLMELGVVLPGDDGRADPGEAVRRYGLYSRRNPHEIADLADDAERSGIAAAQAVEMLGPRPTLAELRRAAAHLRHFDETSGLLEAMQPEAVRGLLAQVRATLVGKMAGVLIARAQRHKGSAK